MEIILICAQDPKGVIGKNGALPWKNSEELKFFKKKTTGHGLIVGMNTFNSIPPLPNRVICGVSKKNKFFVEDALDMFREVFGSKKVFIAGGKQIYEYCLDRGYPDKLIISIMDEEFDGDTKIDFSKYHSKYFISSIKKKKGFRVVTWKKRLNKRA